jgi:hypothetical protein
MPGPLVKYMYNIDRYLAYRLRLKFRIAFLELLMLICILYIPTEPDQHFQQFLDPFTDPDPELWYLYNFWVTQ